MPKYSRSRNTDTNTDTFHAVAPGGHVLTSKEWKEVIADNVTVLGKRRTRVSRFKLEELQVVCSSDLDVER